MSKMKCLCLCVWQYCSAICVIVISLCISKIYDGSYNTYYCYYENKRRPHYHIDIFHIHDHCIKNYWKLWYCSEAVSDVQQMCYQMAVNQQHPRSAGKQYCSSKAELFIS